MRFFLAYLFVCLVLTLLAAEYALRVMHPDLGTTPVYAFDPKSIVVTRPNISVRDKYGRQFRSNALGARGGPLDPAANTVLVFGDSNIAGRFADEEDTYPVRLADEIAVQVGNFGVNGYGPDQSLLRLKGVLEKRLPVGKVRAVVFQIFADNDLGDLIRNALPEFDPRQQRAHGTGARTHPDLSAVGQVASRSLVVRTVWERFLQSRFASIVRPADYYEPAPAVDPLAPPMDIIRANVAAQLYEWSGYKQGKYTAWNGDHYDGAIAFALDPELTAAAAGTLERVLRAFLEVSRQAGFCPLVVVEPSARDTVNTWRVTPQDMAAYAREQGYTYDPRLLSRLIEQTAGKIGLPMLSLFDDFKDKPYYFRKDELFGDDHWNPAGMKEAARLTARELRKSCAFFAAGR